VFELHEHPSFVEMFFDANNGAVNVYDKDEVQVEKKDSIAKRFWNHVSNCISFRQILQKNW
jgi:hypothetical protein